MPGRIIDCPSDTYLGQELIHMAHEPENKGIILTEEGKIKIESQNEFQKNYERWERSSEAERLREEFRQKYRPR